MPSAPLQHGAALLPAAVADPTTGKSLPVLARVDTGADQTLVDTKVIQQLPVSPIGDVPIEGVFGSPEDEREYTVNLLLGPNGSYGSVPLVRVLATDLTPLGLQALIGVDVLQTGVFGYDGLAGTFSLAVGVPAATRPARAFWWVLAIPGTAAVFGTAAWFAHQSSRSSRSAGL